MTGMDPNFGGDMLYQVNDHGWGRDNAGTILLSYVLPSIAWYPASDSQVPSSRFQVSIYCATCCISECRSTLQPCIFSKPTHVGISVPVPRKLIAQFPATVSMDGFPMNTKGLRKYEKCTPAM